MRVLLFAALVGMILIPTLPAPALAWHAPDDAPILHSESGSGHQWVARKVDTDGSLVVFEIRIHAPVLPSNVGITLHDATGTTLYGRMYSAIPTGNTGVSVRADDLVGQRVHEGEVVPEGPYGVLAARILLNGDNGQVIAESWLETEDGTAAGGSASTGYIDPITGTLTGVMWVAGTHDSWTMDIRGNAGTTVLDAETRGNSSFVHLARDFDGTIAEAYAAGAGGRYAEGSLEKQVEGTLIASFSSSKVGAYGFPPTRPWATTDVLRITTPDGESLCPCSFWDAGSRAAPPGTYTFHVSGAGAGNRGLTDLFLGGVDVILPA